jgi:uncharacterized protein (TIGR02246 family)
MKKPSSLRLCIALLITGFSTAMAQTPTADAHEPDRLALRALAARYERAIADGDLMSLQDSILPDASAVFMTGDEVTGVSAMQTFLDGIKKQLGEGTQYSVKLNPNPTRFEGALAIASGTSDEKVTFGNGKELTYQTKWTASLKKEDGKWLAMRLHVSLDPINNPIITLQARAHKWIVGSIAAVGGLLLGLVLARFRKRA